ncbi:MAG: GntR family transcriptional regulator [Clostridiales bacterium]|nr:GntR family transcriptional regulator [Clostridiales bacterium]
MAKLDIVNFKLDKNIPIPLYYQLKQQIIREITNNRLKPGDSIPTEEEFSRALNISRPTIRQALGELVNEGYIYRLKGKGTFVSPPKIDELFFQKLESFNDEMIKKGLKPSTRVLDLNVIPGIARINEMLNIPLEEKLVYLFRLRFANDEPIVYVETYLPYKDCPGIIEEDFTRGSLYRILEEKYNKRIVRATRKIEAVNASKEDAKLLGIKNNDAILFVRTVAYDWYGTPTEYSEARYRGDRNQFSVDLVRSNGNNHTNQ